MTPHCARAVGNTHTEMRKLWPHQQEALDYCMAHEHKALFLQMRLGKSLVVIRSIIAESPLEHRTLIVAPSSALGPWEDELHLEGQKSIQFLQGTRTRRGQLLNKPKRWNLINKEGFLALPELKDKWWDAVVLDESPFIKSPSSQVTKFFCKWFRNVPHRYILTGTPNPESLLDFYCQLAFLDGNAFRCKTYWDFRAHYFIPDQFHRWWPRIGTRDLIQRTLAERCFILRRKDVALDQPKVYEKRTIEMPPAGRKLYDKVEKEFATFTQETSWAFTRHAWLRRLASGFDPDTDKLLWDEKYTELLNLLQGELKDEPIIVWFGHRNVEIDTARKLLHKHKISCASLYGSDLPVFRRETFKAFDAGNIQVLLLQVKIAQYSLNLSRAQTCVYFSNSPSRMNREQTEDRILVAGRKTPLLYLDLLTKNSVDGDMLRLLQRKGRQSITTLELAKAIQDRIRGGM